MWGWRGWWGPWPGRGPFSYLPPWQRPGWVFGRGACWYLWPYLWSYYWYPRSAWWPYYWYWPW
ncbi:MAG: hypothetical protein DSO07_00110 [Thermoproteota archaeon]|nr:MAG: hypothetical protein DSO07_00110 [Candidatus Korarchaeota archaeon]